MRKLALFAGSFSLGIFLAQYLLPGGWLLPGALACFGAGCIVCLLPDEVRKRGLLLCLGLSLALGYDWLYVRQVQAPMEALADAEVPVTMTLQDYPEPTNYGAKTTVKVDDLPGKLVYYGSKNLLELEPGQTVTAEVRLQSAARIRDDDVTSFTSKGVFLLAYQQGEETVGSGSAGSLRWLPVRWGHALRERIDVVFSGETAGVLRAILTGDRAGLSEEAAIDLSEAGIYHILAVSGMHCGYLLAFVMLLTGRHRRRLAAAVAIPVLVFYALLTGCSPSVVRACLMLSLLVAAPLFRRESDGPTSLLTALLLILLQNPFAVASISLQLSFTAVAGLLWLTPRLNRLLTGGKKWGKVYTYIAAGFSATMGALVFSAPVSAYYFRFLSLVSPLTNLLCLWAAGIVFVAGLAAVLFSFLWLPLGTVLGVIPCVLIRYILLCTELLADLPYHAVYFADPYLKYWLAFAYLLFAAAYFVKPKGGRKYALAAVLAALSLGVTIHLGENRYQNDLDIIMLDVGQGQSVVLASEDMYLLVDCGSGNSWYDAGEIAAYQLLAMGCDRLDYLLLTHYDADHVSGVTGLLARIGVDTLLVPAESEDDLCEAVWIAAQAHGTTVEVVEEIRKISLGKSEVTVFPPLGTSDDNERGLSVLASAGEEDFLLTGDMDAATERRLLKTYDLPDIEILAAGHHGSKNSTSEDLLDALTPEIVCISVGSNSYGHPADETLRRLALHQSTICRTDLQGNLYLSMNGGEHHGIREEKEQ